MKSIKECPRCGWIAKAHREKDCGWYVQCENCGRMTDEYYINPEDAVKEWNGDKTTNETNDSWKSV